MNGVRIDLDDDMVVISGVLDGKHFTRHYIRGVYNVTHSDGKIARRRMELVKLLGVGILICMKEKPNLLRMQCSARS